MSDEILNPIVYLNYLAPDVANEYEVSRNVCLATLGALIWDIFSSLPEDWQIARTSKPMPVLFAYFSARICALVVVLLSVLMMTGPITQCGVLVFNICVFWVIASAANSYLFLKRVHACFSKTGSPLRDYYEFAGTKHCIGERIADYVSAAFIVPGLFDALVFLAVTITAGFNVTRIVVTLLPSSSPVLQKLFSTPAVALNSVMACRVFRNLRLAALREIGTPAMMRFVHGGPASANAHRLKSGDDATTDTDFGLEERINDQWKGIGDV
ncbi:hypothetical protein BU15DRAFT_83581 [Melanogaster broomeanus]|nr:hypothetical protein BU15DRAFT_83581 [Melanogaster broomeanus]